jgi:hypothetical protein
MMPLAQFCSLPLEKQAEYILKNGRVLSGRTFDSYYICLFSVDHFLAEVWFDHWSTDRVSAINPGNYPSLLEAYLSGVSINQLFE